MGLYAYLDGHPHDISSLKRVACGGSALPRPFVEGYAKKYGVPFKLLWGMTETAPVATMMPLGGELDAMPDDEKFELLSRHGIPLPGIDLRIVDDQGRELPWDGQTMGELQVRGLWVISEYWQVAAAASFMDGWFRTGDVATIDRHGLIQITDRTKDLVKSGGEWISTVDLENQIMSASESGGGCRDRGLPSQVAGASAGLRGAARRVSRQTDQAGDPRIPGAASREVVAAG